MEVLLKDTTFLSAVGAAVGGFIGVVLFFIIRIGVELCRLKSKEVHSYKCGNELNQGQQNEVDGELLHHHGRRVADKSEYESLDAKNPLWEWSRNAVGRGAGASLIYGPYTTDPSEPGLYKAIFKIKGIGFSKPKEIINDLILLKLDVNKTIPGYAVTNSQLSIIPQQYEIGRHFIRVSDLAKGGWHSYEVPFYSDGQGIWEYRIYAHDSHPDNIGQFGSNVRILFDTITIKKIRKFQLPWM